jgi:calcium/calmodulin-dependent protein kinase kinase 2
MPGDIWAMGVTLFSLVFGKVPFSGNSIMQLYDAIREEEPLYPNDIDPLLLDLLKRLLDKNPESRITIEELRVIRFNSE